MGGDSIMSIRIIAKAKQKGIRIAPDLLFRFQTIADLSKYVEYEEKAKTTERFVGELGLTPIQHWFFESHTGQLTHWNQGVRIRFSQPVPMTSLEQFARGVLSHDGLRQTFIDDPNWQAQYKDLDPQHLISVGNFENEGDLLELQKGLSLQEGPLIKMGIPKGDHIRSLIIVAHHLIVDVVTWGLLLDELSESLHGKHKANASRAKDSFAQWAQYLQSEKAKSLFVAPNWTTGNASYLIEVRSLAQNTPNPTCSHRS